MDKHTNQKRSSVGERKYNETDYYSTQFLIGHGCFEEYLLKFGHDDGPDCYFCRDIRENSLRIFLIYARYT